MKGLMQDWPLRVTTIIDHAARFHGDREIVTRTVEGPIALTACIEGAECTIDRECRVKAHWPVVNEALRGALAGIPLTQLAVEKEIA